MLTDTEGIVLRQVKTSYGRRMILLFSKKSGKISAGTGLNERGKGKSSLALRPFTYGRYELFKNRDSYNINGAEVLKSYYGIGEDVDKYMNGAYVLEFTERVLAEEVPSPGIFSLLIDFFDLLENRDGLMLGICNGFQALIKLGLVPEGKIVDGTENSPTLTYNKIGRHASCLVRTGITSVKSPWLAGVNVGDVFTIPVSHGEGRFIASGDVLEKLKANGQIATQYVDFDGNPSMDIAFNPNGSVMAIEGITSPDGRGLG